MSQLITRLKIHNFKKSSLIYLFAGFIIFISSYIFASSDFGQNNTPHNKPDIHSVNFSMIKEYEPEIIHKTADFNDNKHEIKTEYKKIPILIYHYIRDDKSNSDLVMPKHRFREQMKFLKDNNFTTITMDELYSHFQDGKALPEKPVVISVDDGDKDLYINAFPILKEFNFKATFFVITGRIDKHPLHLSSQELIELQKNGIDIESHTANHEKLDDLTYAHQLATLQNSKAVLEKLLKKEVKHIAYPYGAFNEETKKAVRDAGYKTALSGRRGLAVKSNDIYELCRIYIGRADGMKLYMKVLKGDFSLK